ncbi:hypothetical protein CGCA056_v001814 [Colletotrichum aenigma]|uniref:uncharacterized protein n=1 Tax=Colletotrichum aenigma TaxID=1215731 RepID=UPI00187282B1|nr:uncharacterized protein CGCA056_v001814 [Colletotrichum aenigma]KAF5526837.1 hypothetical protein CGCA056_v001814 [Colletotrichum aenigma]
MAHRRLVRRLIGCLYQPSSRSHSHPRAQPRYVTYHLEALGNTTTTRFWTRERQLTVPRQPRTQASLSFCQFLPFGSLVTRYAGQEEGIYAARSFLAPPSTDTPQAKSELPYFTTTSFPANQPSTSKSKKRTFITCERLSPQKLGLTYFYQKTHQHTFNMPFFYSKPIGGKNFGTSVHADRHGIRRGPWRFRIGRFNCFR